MLWALAAGVVARSRALSRARGVPKPSVLRVPPVAGDAILFYDTLPSGRADVSALHGSCPVVQGGGEHHEKWVAQVGE